MNNLSENTPSYYLPFHSKSYWEGFYQQNNLNQSLEWYLDLQKYKSENFDLKKLNPQAELLVLGVGNAKLINYFIESKFSHITLVDFSVILVQWLRSNYASKKECAEWDFVCQDVTKLTSRDVIPSNFYQIIVDKACLDCILSDPDSKKSEESFINALTEIKKALSENGTFYHFSTATPEKRVSLLTRVFNCKIDIEEISMNADDVSKEFTEADNIYYLYIIG